MDNRICDMLTAVRRYEHLDTLKILNGVPGSLDWITWVMSNIGCLFVFQGMGRIMHGALKKYRVLKRPPLSALKSFALLVYHCSQALVYHQHDNPFRYMMGHISLVIR